MSQLAATTGQPEARRDFSVAIHVCRTLAELALIAEPWDELVLRQLGRLPMLSYSWVSAHLEARQSEERSWFCLVAFDDNELVGVLPLEERRVTVLGKQVVLLCQPGDGHTPSVDVVVKPGYERAVLEAFRRKLGEVVPGWYGLELLRIEESSAIVTATVDGGIGGTRAVRNPGGLATIRGTQGTWDEFFESSSGHFRKHFRQYGRKLAKLGKVEVEFVVGAEAGEPAWLERFAVLEAAGWKGRMGSAIAADPHLMGFYRLLCARLHCRGALEWHFLKVDNTYVAGHMAMRSGRTLVLWKIGYDEEYSACSPGFLLIGEMLKRAFADPETDEVNFVTDRTWLKNWRPEMRPYYDVWIYPKRVRSTVAGVWPKRARQRLREVPGLKAALKGMRGLLGR